VDDVNEQSPNDAAYVYSGYAPITIRLVETAFQKQDTTGSASKQAPALARRIPSWRGAEEVLKLVPGGQAFERELTASNQQHAEGGQSKTVIVVFIGGCTYTEISALRFLSQQSGGWFFATFLRLHIVLISLNLSQDRAVSWSSLPTSFAQVAW
jgi:hypothetical protein